MRERRGVCVGGGGKGVDEGGKGRVCMLEG